MPSKLLYKDIKIQTHIDIHNKYAYIKYFIVKCYAFQYQILYQILIKVNNYLIYY